MSILEKRQRGWVPDFCPWGVLGQFLVCMGCNAFIFSRLLSVDPLALPDF